jgi:RhtX/FptX family siderophore transporter
MTAPGTLSPAGKLGLLGSLYLAQGLPFGFFTQALPVLLRREGHTLGAIGLTSLLALPWALKFAWAPLVDRFSGGRLGKRTSWVVPVQVLTVAVLTLLAVAGESSLPLLLAAVFVLNLLAATQDIATDGLAVDMLERAERGFANGLQVAGYRTGMILGGGVLLIAYERLGSSATFAAMALVVAMTTFPLVLLREPRTEAGDVARSPSVAGFFRREGAWKMLALVVTYKLGDAFATGMLRPFLVDRGLGLADIGWLLGTVGFVAGLLGALAGGVFVNRLGRRRALLVFGLLQATTILGYAYLAARTPSSIAFYAVCAGEHFAGGMATAALFTLMMDACSRETSATDYTVQASAVVIATGLASAVAGVSAETFGYFAHFCAAALLSLVGLAGVVRWVPRAAAPCEFPDTSVEARSCA